MKKILVVISGGLPIPSIKGGAVETLIDMYLEENEKNPQYKFEVYSTYADGVEEKTKEYKNCKFNYVHAEKFGFKISRYTRAFLNKILHIPVRYAFINEVIKKIKRNKEEFDLVIVENNAMLVSPLAQIFPGKIILHLHNDNVNKKIRGGIKTYKDCKRIYTVSDYIKSRVDTIGKNKTVTLFNGIDINGFKERSSETTRKEMRKRFNIKNDEVVFIFSGRVCEDKGVKELIKAFTELRKKYDKIKLLIVGASFFSSKKKTPYIKELIQLSDEFKEDIIFTGYIDYKDMAKVYSAADIQVVPSMFDDPCPLTVIEGMVMGLPQIVSISGGIPEEVSDENAIKVNRENIVKELEDAMTKLINDENLRKSMARASLKRSELFDKKSYTDNFFKLIEEEFEN